MCNKHIIINSDNTCCVIGNREIEVNEHLKNVLRIILEFLILYNNVQVFLFGSKSKFNDICYEIVSKLKEKHPNIKRIYVRAEFPYINDSYKEYLSTLYEDSFFPEKILGAGKYSYIERNFEMIRVSNFCLFYNSENYNPKEKEGKWLIKKRKSGTKQAFIYAHKLGKNIINICDFLND